MISRFSQVHQHGLVKSLTDLNSIYADRLSSYANTFIHQAGDMMNATYMAGENAVQPAYPAIYPMRLYDNI